ncbi:shikimate dehydrogenase, partial [Actinoplanes sp. NPDC026623]|uniref:shikimate dehydrogenase n=1 Tax=Actinoplanes sp. NPDC026623 TaxID=3155610 RepID=UPI0033E9206D
MGGADGRFVVGLIGAGIGSSLSPPLHEREADDQGLRYIYQLIDIAALGLAAADVGELVRTARQLGFRGLNVTHPCKQEVLGHLDELSPEAAELGAVNTVVFTGGRSVGHNTDRHGFAESFRLGLPGAATGRVVLIGAGGAGAAVAHAMARRGAGHLTVVDAERDRAR